MFASRGDSVIKKEIHLATDFSLKNNVRSRLIINVSK